MHARKTNDTKTARGYTRVSTAFQSDHGVSLDAQAVKIRQWCDFNGYELTALHTDRGLSGGRSDNRPALQEVLRTLEPGETLVVYSLSRLSRSTKETLMIVESLAQKGADLVSLTERIDTSTSAGKMVTRLLAVLAEFERDAIAERTTLAMAHLRSQGRFTGGQEPFGYKAVDGVLRANPDEVQIIRLIHQLGSEGGSLRSISKRLLELGFTSRAGTAFHPAQIARLLKAPVPEAPAASIPSNQSQTNEDTNV